MPNPDLFKDTRDSICRWFWFCYVRNAGGFRRYVGVHVCDDFGNLVPVVLNRRTLED